MYMERHGYVCPVKVTSTGGGGSPSHPTLSQLFSVYSLSLTLHVRKKLACARKYRNYGSSGSHQYQYDWLKAHNLTLFNLICYDSAELTLTCPNYTVLTLTNKFDTRFVMQASFNCMGVYHRQGY